MHRFNLPRSIRYTVIASAFVASTVFPTVPVSAQSADTFALPAPPAAISLSVDLPAPQAIVANGQMVDIGGWSAGSRVDVYLDGVAGAGEGIGSATVNALRPDVAAATGDRELADAGFNLGWMPTSLTAGEHMLYVYSLVDGSWIFHTVPIIALGNAYFASDSSSNGRSESDFDAGAAPAEVSTETTAGE